MVTPQGVGAFDIAITGEKIVAVAAKGSLPVADGTRLIDAGGKIVMPGGIDPHVHCKWFLPNPDGNLRPALERHLRAAAKAFLVQRAQELAGRHRSVIRRVVIRNQKSRWGSCSCQGTISLNWRLIQLPEQVRDYIIIHELMHLRQLNHSPQFWAEVAEACPGYRAAEEWLKLNSGQVGF